MAKGERLRGLHEVEEPRYLADGDFWDIAPFGWLYWMESVGGRIRESTNIEADRIIFITLNLVAKSKLIVTAKKFDRHSVRQSSPLNKLKKDGVNIELMDEIGAEINRSMSGYDLWEDYMSEYGWFSILMEVVKMSHW